MTIEEFRALKGGDMIEYNKLVYELKEIKLMIGGRNFMFSGCTRDFIVVERANRPYEIIFKPSTVDIDYGNGFHMFKKLTEKETFEFKYNIGMIREHDLTQLIPKKEIELSNLKKELEELKQKNMLARIIPGNVYRFTLCDKPNIILCVRDVSEHKVYTVNLINDLWGNFYHSEVTNVELLPELTEAYKNFKTLLETA